MGPLEHQSRLIAEVSHQINSPLAAIRNALYLAASRTDDVEIRRYLELADQEVSAIANRIKHLTKMIDGELPPPTLDRAQKAVQRARKAA